MRSQRARAKRTVGLSARCTQRGAVCCRPVRVSSHLSLSDWTYRCDAPPLCSVEAAVGARPTAVDSPANRRRVNEFRSTAVLPIGVAGCGALGHVPASQARFPTVCFYRATLCYLEFQICANNRHFSVWVAICYPPTLVSW